MELSPAIDRGKSFGLTTDPRGDPRRFDHSSIANGTNSDGADIGSFEAIPVALPIFTITELPGLSGNQTVPLAINSSGQNVGYSADESGYRQAAF